MIELIADKQWHGSNIADSGSPTLNYSVMYEAERPNIASATVRARFQITMRSIYSDAWFGYPLYCKFSLNNKEYTVTDNFGEGIKSVSYTTEWIEFSNSGTSQSVTVTPRCGDLSHTYTDTATISFAAMEQYATVTQSLSSKTLDSITMSWSSDSTIDYIWYSTDNGSNWTGKNISDGKSGSYTISGLSPNTTYKIKTRVRRKDSQLTTDSSALSVTTYDIARITSYSDFNLGSSLTVGYTNPSGATIQVGIYDTTGKNAYAEYRTVTGSSYKFSFTDTELDTMYKAMGKTNTLKAKLYINTNDNEYKESKDITVTLTGNQKTGHVNVNGSWKRTKKYVNVNGTWRRCVRWVQVDGVWRRTI